MTLDRDIRFSPEQITIMQRAIRDEIKKRTRSICTAEASRAAGNTIQQGTLDEHYRALKEARQIGESLEVARRQIGHQMARMVGAA